MNGATAQDAAAAMAHGWGAILSKALVVAGEQPKAQYSVCEYGYQCLSLSVLIVEEDISC
ncbi:MAG: hypothetical protein DMG05_26080 [Acidobacteria bacterium]|nr:MAG: hypothetical protein DMG05_26080 [Acidobacteriota bacterium]